MGRGNRRRGSRKPELGKSAQEGGKRLYRSVNVFINTRTDRVNHEVIFSWVEHASATITSELPSMLKND